jgi:hypothetical protein
MDSRVAYISPTHNKAFTLWACSWVIAATPLHRARRQEEGLWGSGSAASGMQNVIGNSRRGENGKV